jgi:hypothetical protein
MKLNSTMAVMAVVCVAVVIGGELTLTPIGGLHLIGFDSENSNNSANRDVVDALVVYDEKGDAVALYADQLASDAIGQVTHKTFQDLDKVFQDNFGGHDWQNGGGDNFLDGNGAITPMQFPAGDVSPPQTVNVDGTDLSLLGFDDWPLSDGGANNDFVTGGTDQPGPPGPPPPTDVPEPSAWTLMTLGVGAIGLALRRARRAWAAAARI